MQTNYLELPNGWFESNLKSKVKTSLSTFLHMMHSLKPSTYVVSIEAPSRTTYHLLDTTHAKNKPQTYENSEMSMVFLNTNTSDVKAISNADFNKCDIGILHGSISVYDEERKLLFDRDFPLPLSTLKFITFKNVSCIRIDGSQYNNDNNFEKLVVQAIDTPYHVSLANEKRNERKPEEKPILNKRIKLNTFMELYNQFYKLKYENMQAKDGSRYTDNQAVELILSNAPLEIELHPQGDDDVVFSRASQLVLTYGTYYIEAFKRYLNDEVKAFGKLCSESNLTMYPFWTNGENSEFSIKTFRNTKI